MLPCRMYGVSVALIFVIKINNPEEIVNFKTSDQCMFWLSVYFAFSFYFAAKAPQIQLQKLSTNVCGSDTAAVSRAMSANLTMARLE